MSDFTNRSDFLKATEEVWVLNKNTCRLVSDYCRQFVEIDCPLRSRNDDDLGRLVGEIGFQSLNVFRVRRPGNHNSTCSSGAATSHQDGFSDPASPLVQAGIGNIQAAQLGNQRLKFEEGLQSPLAGFGLIRSVRRIEFTTRGEFIDDAGNVVVISSATHKADA